MDDQTVAGSLECSDQESDTLLKQEWHGNGSGSLLWPTLTWQLHLHKFTGGLGIVLNISWNTKRRNRGMISFWRLLVAHSTMTILSFRMGGSSSVWEQMKGWNRRSVNHDVGIFLGVSSTRKHISGVSCSVGLCWFGVYRALWRCILILQIVSIPIIEFEMNAADSDSQQSRQVSLHLPYDLSGVHPSIVYSLTEREAIWTPSTN